MTANSPVGSPSFRSVTVSCPPGKSAIGGGGFVSPAFTVAEVALQASYPAMSAGRAVGWTAVGAETIPFAGNWSIVVYATCALTGQ